MVRLGGDSSQLAAALAGGGSSTRAFANTVAIAMNSLPGPIGLVTAALATLAAASVVQFAQFNDAMTQSLAITTGVTEEQKQRMEDLAKSIAESSTFSASEVTKGYYELFSSGLNAEQSMASIGTVAKFAQAGMMDLDSATKYLTTSQSALGLKSKDATENMMNMAHVADVLTAVNNMAIGHISDFAAALTNKLGAALQSTGKSIEEGAALMGALAEAGYTGTKAGQMLSSVLIQLQTSANKHADAFKKAGIEVYDASGKMKNMGDIAQEFHNKMQGASDETVNMRLTSMGLNRQVYTTMLTLAQHSDKIKEYEERLKSAGGETERVANNQMQSFGTRVTTIIHALEDRLLEIGERIAPALLAAFDAIGQWFNTYGPAIAKIWSDAVPFLEAFGRGLLVIIGVVATLDGVIIQWISQHTALIGTFAVIAAWLLGFPVAIAAIIAAIGVWSQHWREIHNFITQTVQDIVNTVLEKLVGMANFALGIWDLIKLPLAVMFAPLVVSIGVAMLAFNALRDRWDAISEGIHSAINTVTTGFRLLWGMAVDAVKQRWDDFVKTWSDRIETVRLVFSMFGDALHNTFGGVFQGIADGFNKLVGFFVSAINMLPEGIRKFFGSTSKIEFNPVDFSGSKVASSAAVAASQQAATARSAEEMADEQALINRNRNAYNASHPGGEHGDATDETWDENGVGGGSGKGTKLSDAAKAMKSTLASIAKTLQDDQIKALEKGGEKQLAIVVDQQARMRPVWQALAKDLETKLGIEPAAALKEAFDATEKNAMDMLNSVKNVEDTLQKERVEALLKGGQKQLDIVTASQDGMRYAIYTTANMLNKTFGIDMPEAMKEATQSVTKSAQDMQKAVEDAAKKQKDDAFNLTKQLWGSLGTGPNKYDKDGKLIGGPAFDAQRLAELAQQAAANDAKNNIKNMAVDPATGLIGGQIGTTKFSNLPSSVIGSAADVAGAADPSQFKAAQMVVQAMTGGISTVSSATLNGNIAAITTVTAMQHTGDIHQVTGGVQTTGQVVTQGSIGEAKYYGPVTQVFPNVQSAGAGGVAPVTAE